MTTDTIAGPRAGYQCKHCPASTRSSRDAARMLGWRMFTGVSITGKPIDDVVCPACAGTAAPEDAPLGWRVRCDTCDWEYLDEDDDGPLDAKNAKMLADLHQCESEVRLAPPSGDKWFQPGDFDRDGNLRGKFIVRVEPAAPERWQAGDVGALVLQANGDA